MLRTSRYQMSQSVKTRQVDSMICRRCVAKSGWMKSRSVADALAGAKKSKCPYAHGYLFGELAILFTSNVQSKAGASLFAPGWHSNPFTAETWHDLSQSLHSRAVEQNMKRCWWLHSFTASHNLHTILYLLCPSLSYFQIYFQGVCQCSQASSQIHHGFTFPALKCWVSWKCWNQYTDCDTKTLERHTRGVRPSPSKMARTSLVNAAFSSRARFQLTTRLCTTKHTRTFVHKYYIVWTFLLLVVSCITIWIFLQSNAGNDKFTSTVQYNFTPSLCH